MTDDTLLPAIGSEEFHALNFSIQLEIKSLQLFHPEEYHRQVHGTAPPTARLELPSNDHPDIDDFPAAILRDYWAGYCCSFKEKWYTLNHRSKTSPLDVYGIDHKWLVNLHCFTFPLLALDKLLFQLFQWVAKSQHRNRLCYASFLDALKMYAWVATPGNNSKNKNKILWMAQEEYVSCYSVEDLNGEFPLVEPCAEIDYLEWEEFVLLNQGRYKYDRFLLPFLPASLYNHSYFRLSTWDFVDAP